MRYGILALAASAIAALPSYSQVTVIGGGMAKDCYEAAETTRLTASEAIEVCDNALKFETLTRNDRVSTLINRGILHMRTGNYRYSMNDYETAIRLSPDKAEAYLNMGANYIYQEEYDLAKEVLDKAINLGTDDLFAAYYNRGIANERIGDITSAYWDFRKSLDLNPEFEIAERQLERFIVTEEPGNAGGAPV